MAAKCSVVTRFRNTLGLPGRLSVRLQPNHPTDDRSGHRRQHPRRPPARRRRRGHRHQSRDRQSGARPRAAVHARRDRLKLDIPTQIVRAGACDDDARADPAAARRSTSSSSRSPEHKRPTEASASTSRCWPRRAMRRSRSSAAASATTSCISRPDRERAVRQRPSRRRSADPRGPRLRRGAAVPPVAGQHGGRLHRAGVPLRRQADHARRPGGPFLRQAPGPADGLSTSATRTTPRPIRTTWMRC